MDHLSGWTKIKTFHGELAYESDCGSFQIREISRYGWELTDRNGTTYMDLLDRMEIALTTANALIKRGGNALIFPR